MPATALIWRACCLLFLAPVVLQAQALETETTRLLPKHGLEIGTNFEYQFSSEGRESALPVAITYGLTNTWELLVEPVPHTAIRPNGGARATGLGDLEITITHRFLSETPGRPALALAGEVKLPTAESRVIGSDLTDYTAYLIGSKRLGRLDLHANLGYTILGKPAGLGLQNVANFAIGGMLDLGPKTRGFAEILGTTSAGGNGPENSSAPEVGGGELSGTIGLGRNVGQSLFLTLGMSYDNSGALLLRPGFTWRLH